jgi:uncharacterized protein (TIGR00730 family)
MTGNCKPEPDPLAEAVSALMSHVPIPGGDSRTGPLVRSMIETCIALARDPTPVVDLKLVDSALSEIRAALNCFRPYAHVRKVTMFGSARTRPEEPEYDLARTFASNAADAGYMAITGAGPGIMHACQEGAGRERSFGVNIKLPFENDANPEIHGDEKLVEFKYFFTRKLFFLKESSAIVLFPGGFGTHDEGFEALTLIQTGKSRLVPVIFLDTEKGTYWKTWDQYVRDHILRLGLIGPDDMSLYTITNNADEAVREIQTFYRTYHSSRTIRGRLVIRTNHEVAAPVLEALSAEFADILGGRPIVPREPYHEEFDEPALTHLPRIELAFDTRSYGRLRQLINRLNES